MNYILNFQTTHRVTINLPLGQKYVVRVRPDISLSELFDMGVAYKSLDPARHRLCHPTNPDMALDVNAPLNSYGIIVISVVPLSVTGASARPGKILFPPTIFTSSFYFPFRLWGSLWPFFDGATFPP